MLNKEEILALAWEHSEGSGKRYTFTEESLFLFLKELKKEPAPAQDERDSFKRYRLAGEFCVSRGIDDDSEIRPKILDAFCSGYACATRPAQTEQLPVAMPTDAQLIEIARRLEALPELCNTVDHPDVRWRINPDVRDLVREVLKGYAAPIAQIAPKIAAKMPCGTAVTNVYEAYEAGKRAAAPQPEQSGLVPEGYVLLPKQCPSWLEDVYDYCCQGDGSLYLPAYDAMVKALEEHQKELLNNG